MTVQCPIYNERDVAPRLVRAVAALDWPRDRLEIQVLDDSTDLTSGILEDLVRGLRSEGVRIVHLRRARRAGYKAGALQEGLRSARGEFIAIFDADFVPPPDFLLRLLPWFADPGVGMVQARWGHLNRGASLLTRAQAMSLDGHFIVEHGARSASGRFFNFNGTAGVWRRLAIEEAGGWQSDTLTEDMDLSYRAQMRGWRFLFLPDLVAPAELPEEIAALKAQQHRWTKGSVETARKMLPAIWRARLPLATRFEATLHLTTNLAYPLLAALGILLVPSVFVRHRLGLTGLATLDFALFLGTTCSIVLFYFVAERGSGESLSRTIRTVPALFALGIGVSLSNARGVLEALAGRHSAFVRTPKKGTRTGAVAYRVDSSLLLGLLETGLAIYFLAAFLGALERRIWPPLPFLALFAAGFGWVGLATLRDVLARDRRSARASTSS